jgi:hypothetical protein
MKLAQTVIKALNPPFYKTDVSGSSYFNLLFSKEFLLDFLLY